MEEKSLFSEGLALVQRLIFTTAIIYIFFSFNTLYSINILERLHVFSLVVYIVYQCFVLLVGFCFFRMTIAKNSTTLELFPEIEDKEESSSEESLHLNPFEKDNIFSGENEMEICSICKTSKPLRSYHCSKCKKCLLLMYKHLDCFDICIGFTNYKFYIVFLFYSIILSGIGLGAFIYGISSCDLHFSGGDVICFFAPMVVALILQSLLLLIAAYEFVNAVWYVLINQIPEERKRAGENGKDKDISYDLGMYENWKMIMGPKWYMWFFPIWSTEGDGIKFTSARKLEMEKYQEEIAGS